MTISYSKVQVLIGRGRRYGHVQNKNYYIRKAMRHVIISPRPLMLIHINTRKQITLYILALQFPIQTRKGRRSQVHDRICFCLVNYRHCRSS